jgi:hypothetical protein
MGADVGAGPGIQFDKVETTGASAPPVCARCQRVLDEYFELGGRLFCRPCIDGVNGGAGGGSVGRGLLFGAGAAAVGCLVWAAVLQLSKGSSYGIIGIVVGLFVGIAVRKGARGLGGWRFQAIAMTLTYLAITTSSVPALIDDTVPTAAVVVIAFVNAAVAPFMGGTSFMGWIIIGIALYEAWKINRRVRIAGPFRFSGAVHVPPGSLVAPTAPGS